MQHAETNVVSLHRKEKKSAVENASAEEHAQQMIGLSQGMLKEVVEALDKIKRVNRTIHILSMNARVEAARAGEAGRGFAVVAEHLSGLAASTEQTAQNIEDTSKSITGELNVVAERLSKDVTDNRMCDLALNAIDLIDRNLYERSCDVRWWATDSALVEAAKDPSPDNLRYVSQRLGQILDSYTVYFDLVLANLDGRVIANGRPQQWPQARGANAAGSEWFKRALATRSGTQFGFESVHSSALVSGQNALVYSCVVRERGAVHGKPLGVLGIVFNWDALGQETLKRIPLSSREASVTRAVLADDSGRVLADSDPRRIGESIAFDGRDVLFSKARGATTARIGGSMWRIAHASSPGFETYATGWHSLLLRKADA
ncbi:MAG: methyl-accepting chemotaxis protein [Betaproteobacteria bacterium]|nr:methyl-accepting chemotaxis protein [Betaproteobacteria bacterium]